MSELPSTPSKFQWKWVGISLLMYIVFYFLPLSLVPGGFLSGTVVTKASAIFIGIWSFAGMFIIAAVAGFISKGITIREPAVAALGLVILWIVAIQIMFNIAVHFTAQSVLGLLLALAIAVILALGGAWFGERLQKVLTSKAPDAN